MDKERKIKRIFYRPEEAWFGDAIPFYEDGVFYIYYLYDQRKTPVTADHTSWHLVSTKDLLHWKEEGEVLPAGGVNNCDQACYTGSVIRGRDGYWHMFYTGQNPLNPDFGSGGKALQYILHAVSRDLINWDKHYETAFTAPEGHFEPHDWRDPFVFYQEETESYYMLLAARLQGKSLRKSGCVAVCRSVDLWNWGEAEVFFAPEMYYTHECPDLFQEGGWWYLLYSTFTTRFVTHYRKSRTIEGPWEMPGDDLLDARGMYAIKTAFDGKRRYGFGWIPTWHERDDLSWLEWGGTLAVHEIYSLENGDLAVRLPEMIERAFGNRRMYRRTQAGADEKAPECGNAELFLESNNTVWNFPGDVPVQGLLEAEFTWTEENVPAEFGIGFHMEKEADEGYFFRFEPGYCRFVFDRWPRGDVGGEQHRMGGDIPFVPAFERPFDPGSGRVLVKLLWEDDIAIIYVNDRTAMSVRMCRRAAVWSLFATGGAVTVRNFGWRSEVDSFGGGIRMDTKDLRSFG